MIPFLILTTCGILALGCPYSSLAQTARWNGGTDRSTIRDSLSLTESGEDGYSFWVWVRLSGEDPNFPCIASTKVWERGLVTDLLSSRNMGKTLESGNGLGWTIAIQPDGAWTWNIGDGRKHRLDYIPTAERQCVTDGKWHLLAFTVNRAGTVARLFFDGQNVAIYSINGFGPGTFSRNFIAGADRDRNIPACDITGRIEEATAQNRQMTDREIFDLYQTRFPEAQWPGSETPVTELRVLSWNIWHGARHPGIEKGINQAVEFIRSTDADIITMQETYGSGPVIADRCGYYFYQRSDNLSIMSRYPIEDTHPLYRALWFGGTTIRLSEQQKLNVFCLWINHLPAWRRDSQADGATADALIAGEWKTRAREMKDILGELQPFIQATDQVPLIVGGDFNSPSMLDWGEDTAEWHNGLVVRWPVSEQMLGKGFRDSYRTRHPDPARHTPHEGWKSDARKLTYRIDYLYTMGNQIRVTDAKMYDTHQGDWPSDHPAVLATYRLNAEISEDKNQVPSKR